MPVISVGSTQFCLLHMRQKFIATPKRWLNGRVYRYFGLSHTRSITVRLPLGQDDSDAFWVNVFIRHGVAVAWMWRFWENNCIFKYRSWWLSTISSGTEMDIWVSEIKRSSCLSFSFLFRDWKCSPATNFPRSGRYKYFTYKYLYQLCSIGFAWRNALVSDLCLSLRSPSLQNII